MNTTVINEVMAFLFGRKYFANIVATKGVEKMEVCSFIFATRKAAERHRADVESTLSFRYIDTVSFRTRKVPLELTVKS